MKRNLPLAIAIALLPAAVAAQNAPPGDLVDRIVAVVGDSVLLQTDIDEQLLNMAAAGQTVPDDPAALARLRRQVLDLQINELLLVQAALRDSAVVSEEEVNQAVGRDIQSRIQAFGSETAMIEALAQRGLTMEQYQRDLARQYRRQALIRSFLQKQQRERGAPPATEAEQRAYFEAQRTQLGRRPAMITFRQVVLAVTASDSAKAAARRQAEEVLALLRGGEPFEQLARRFSDDPSTGERGGDLGWFRRGQMVPSFENAAYSLQPGQFSGIVESPYGFHIIRVEKVRGPERQASHILISPEITPADVQRARLLADSVAQRARAGESIQTLYREYSDPTEDERIGPFPVNRLPAPYNTELAGAAAGSVVGPFELPAPVPGQNSKWAVVQVAELTPEGEYTFDNPEVRSQVKAAVEQEKLIGELVTELRRNSHIDVRI